MTIMAKSQSGNDLDLQIEGDNKIHFYAGDISPDSVASSAVLQAGQWYFISATYQAGQPGLLQIFVNGTLNASLVENLARKTNSNPLTIGSSSVFSGRYFNGEIDDASVWNVVETQQQIQTEMNVALKGSELGLVAYLPLNEGSGSTVHDLTSNGNNGVLGNGITADQPSWVVNAQPTVNIQGGSLTGTGALYANVTNAAIVSPGGAGAGALTNAGTYTQTPTATFDVDLGGVAAGSLYDQLNVDGAATLNGTLNVDEINGFAPTSGETFQILDSGPLTGQFAAINGLNGTQVMLEANYGSNSVSLTSENPGILVSPTAGLQTSQAGAAATFTVVLDTPPSANVSIGLSSSNTNAGVVSTSQLVFTPANWNTAQTVTVTGMNDFMDEGNQVYTIITAPAVSTDPQYNGFDASDVMVTNLGIMHAGFAVTPTTGLQTSQAGATATFTVDLTSKPLANVVIGLISSNLNARGQSRRPA